MSIPQVRTLPNSPGVGNLAPASNILQAAHSEFRMVINDLGGDWKVCYGR